MTSGEAFVVIVKVGQVRGGVCLYLIVAFDHFPLPFSNLVFLRLFPSGEVWAGE